MPTSTRLLQRAVQAVPGSSRGETFHSALHRIYAVAKSSGEVSPTDVDYLLHDAQFSHQPVTADDCRILLRICAKAKCPEKSEQILRFMQLKRIKENSASSNMMLELLVASRNLDKAIAVYDRIKAEKLALDETLFPPLIDLVASRGNIARAFALHNRMVRAGSEPAYELLFKACVIGGDPARALKLYSTVNSPSRPLSRQAYGWLIRACIPRRNLEKAFTFFREMLERHIPPMKDTFIALFELCAAARDETKIRLVLAEMVRLNVPVYGEVADAMHTALRACASLAPSGGANVTAALGPSSPPPASPPSGALAPPPPPRGKSSLGSAMAPSPSAPLSPAVASSSAPFSLTPAGPLDAPPSHGSPPPLQLGDGARLEVETYAQEVRLLRERVQENIARAFELVPFVTALRRMEQLPDEGTLYALISAACESHAPSVGAQVLDILAQRGGPVRGSFFNLVVGSFLKRQDPKAALALLPKMKSALALPDSTTLSMALNACVLARDTALAFQLYDELVQRGATPTYLAYCALINACVCSKDLRRALSVPEIMRARGLAPVESTYASLIRVCFAAGDLERPERLLAEMEAAGIAPNIETFTALITGYATAKDSARATRAFARLKEFSLAPTPSMLLSLLRISVESGDIAHALGLLAEMHARGVKPAPPLLSSLFSACAQAKDGAAALRILSIARDLHVTVDAAMCAAAMRALLAVSQYALVADVLEEAVASGAAVDTSLFNVGLKACLKLRDEPRMQRIFSLMQQQQPHARPNSATFAILIRATGFAGDVNAAHCVLSDMLACGLRPDLTTLNALLAVCVGARDEAAMVGVLRMFDERRIAPSVFTYTTLIKSCLPGGDIDKALNVYYRSLLADGLKPDVLTFSALFSVCGSYIDPVTSRETKARLVLEEMVKHNIKPDVLLTATMRTVLDHKSFEESMNHFKNK